MHFDKVQPSRQIDSHEFLLYCCLKQFQRSTLTKFTLSGWLLCKSASTYQKLPAHLFLVFFLPQSHKEHEVSQSKVVRVPSFVKTFVSSCLSGNFFKRTNLFLSIPKTALISWKIERYENPHQSFLARQISGYQDL